MSRYLSLVLLALVGCVSGKVAKEEAPVTMNQYPPKPLEQRKRIAVIDFVDKSNYGHGRLGSAAADVLTTMLVESQQFRVIERQQVNMVFEEQKFQSTGVVKAETAAKVGHILGAEYVVYGVISNFGMRVEATDVVLYQQKKQIAECTVDVRLVHVESTEVLFAKAGDGSASRMTSGTLGVGGRMSYDETLAGNAFRAAVAKMMDGLIAQAP